MARSSGFVAPAPAEEVETTGSAIPLDTLKFVKVELGDLGNELPVGVFLPDGQRLRDFSLQPYAGNQEIILGRLVDANTDSNGNLKDPMKVLKEFLPHVIASIGGYSVEDLAKQMSASKSEFFGRMYMGDVTTLMLAVRLQSQGWEFAMTGKCPECGTITSDDPAKGRPYHDLSTLQVKTLPTLTQKPIFELTLVESFSLYADEITRLWLEPLKLNQFDKLLKSTSGNPKDLDQIKEMVCGIPESSVLANQKGKFFDEELYSLLCQGRDGRVSKNKDLLYKAVGKMLPGPLMQAEMDCKNPRCKNHWEAGIPWISFREFLYFSASTSDDD